MRHGEALAECVGHGVWLGLSWELVVAESTYVDA